MKNDTNKGAFLSFILYLTKRAELRSSTHFFGSHLLVGYTAFSVPTYWQGTPLFRFLLIGKVHRFFSSRLLVGSLNQTRTEAARAYVYSARSSVNDSLYLLNIRLEGSIRTSVRVRYFNSESYRLSAYFTLCHLKHHPFQSICK